MNQYRDGEEGIEEYLFDTRGRGVQEQTRHEGSSHCPMPCLPTVSRGASRASARAKSLLERSTIVARPLKLMASLGEDRDRDG